MFIYFILFLLRRGHNEHGSEEIIRWEIARAEENFEQWQERLIIDLEALDIHKCLEEEKPTDRDTQTKWEKNDRMAKSIIYHGLTVQQLTYVKGCKKVKATIKSLEGSFGDASHTSETIFTKNLPQIHLNSIHRIVKSTYLKF